MIRTFLEVMSAYTIPSRCIARSGEEYQVMGGNLATFSSIYLQTCDYKMQTCATAIVKMRIQKKSISAVRGECFAPTLTSSDVKLRAPQDLIPGI